jgi:AAA+ ATPase superfamily predicted ATPase
MKFYDRKQELSLLREIQKRSQQHAQFTVVTGRRRIGKTQLLIEASKNHTTLYFFVARKAESFLCQDFLIEIKEKLGIPVLGEVNNFAGLLKFLMELSKSKAFTLIIDEFQEFYTVAPSVYSEMQHHWDVNKQSSKINLIVCGSVSSLMNKIFTNTKEPLFGRATEMIKIQAFETHVLKQILSDHNPAWSQDDLLALYLTTGGVAKYVQLLMDGGAYTKQTIIDYIVKQDSLFLTEGQNMLITEFGKEYSTYFTILSTISRGENTRAKIEAIVKREIGGYLTKLERDYSLISKARPIFSKVETKNVRYVLNDNFLSFWFRFIYKYSHIIEIGGYNQLKKIIERDYATYSGIILERYFRTKFIENGNFTHTGGFWDRKGENEIDLILVNELDKHAEIIEIKRNPGNIKIDKLKEKVYRFMQQTGELKDFNITYKGLFMEDM